MLKKIAMLLLLVTALPALAAAAEVKNLKVSQSSDKAVAKYDLVATAGEQEAEVSVAIIIDNKRRTSDQLSISGDFGKGVKVGTGKRIVWNATADLPSGFDGEVKWDLKTSRADEAVFAGVAEAGNPVVLMDTSLGKIKIELFAKEAPLSVKNFLDYANRVFYNGTLFHRVMNGFMIQGGGFTTDLRQKSTSAPIRNEAGNGLKNDRGTVAMARTGAPDSATSQFFINVVNNDGLDRPNPDGFGYAVFGKVIEGMDVVDKIKGVKTGVTMGMPNVPETPVVIKSVTQVK
jgi:peptidyl-prolyl cis-trans isomerase A (cyclophilin A)